MTREIIDKNSIICDCGKEVANERVIVQFYSLLGIFSRVPIKVEYCPFCFKILRGEKEVKELQRQPLIN